MVKLISVTRSTASGKKYTALFEMNNGRQKKVHFGASGMDDYTLTHDEEQRARYRKRHEKDLHTSDPTRAGYLSYFILWGNSTNINTNIAAYKRRFHL
jgi:hypothetical protein